MKMVTISLVAAALAASVAGAGAHPLDRHHASFHGERHSHHHHHWRMTATNIPQASARERFEVKISTIQCGPATAAAAPQWCGV